MIDSFLRGGYRQIGYRLAVTLLPALMVTLVATGPTWARSIGKPCVKEQIGGNPSCTANDVRIGELTVIGPPVTCTIGEPVNLTLIASIESGPERYDIGIWLNESGGEALSDPDGTCYRDYLHPVSTDNSDCDQNDPGPYFNAETAHPGDTCGDVPATGGAETCGATIAACTEGGGTCLFSSYEIVSVTLTCADSNGDLIADVGTCTSWDNNVEDDCTSEDDTDPGTGSKCNCGVINIGNVFVDPCEDIDCEDNNPCTIDSCDGSSGSGVCSNDPLPAGTGTCTDDMPCTSYDGTEGGADACDGAGGCLGTPVACDDGVSCTNDSCNPLDGVCANTADDSNCADDDFCNGDETCDSVNDCQAGTPPDCNDGVGCTDDSCNEASDSCDNVADDLNCTDGQFCNGAETCDPSNDCQAGAPPDCSDGVDCTNDACDEDLDICQSSDDDSNCTDGLFCNGEETCDLLSDCQPGTPPDCNDGVGCTSDSCNEDTDSCDNLADDANCNDELFCNGEEICDPLNDCQAGAAPDCNDSVVCTVDSCDEAGDTCVNTADDSVCNDGLHCNGEETCDTVGDCQAGTPVDCDDGVGCTDDLCNDDTDSCDNTANDANCDDGAFCNGAETCDPTGDCQSGTAIDCSSLDGACIAGFCDEGADACATTPANEGGPCDDMLFCNGVDSCLDGDCSGHTGDPCLPVETCDEIDDICAFCGDGVIEGSEQCEPPSGEDCADFIDNDGDVLIDCADPDCVCPDPLAAPTSCGATCQNVPACKAILDDPAVIQIYPNPKRDIFRIHGRVLAGNPTTLDPVADGFTIVLSNANGVIYTGTLLPGDLKASRKMRYRFKDNTAKAGPGIRDGLFQVRTRFRPFEGILYYTFKVKAFGDFSAATLSLMTTQVYPVDSVGFLTAEWTETPRGWRLRLREAGLDPNVICP